MAEISVQELHKYFGEHHVLKGLSFDLQAGERASIVGPNGCGKTTLLKILAGTEDYEGGVVSIAKGARLGLLEQLPVYDPEVTVREVLWQAFAYLEDMGAQMRRMEEEMARGVEKRFRQSPEQLYSQIVNLLLSDAPDNAGGSQPDPEGGGK